MELKEKKIPDWKKKEETLKKSSFDQSFKKLGINGAFQNTTPILKALITPIQK